jgi:hypothetical protein
VFDGDKDFIPKTVCSVTINEANCDEAEYPTKSWEDLSSSSESETSTVIGEKEAVTAHLNQYPEVSPDELDFLQNNVPVAVPKKSLKKKQERYPPFWRVKHAIRNVGDNDGYKSEEDPDFLPENEDVNGSKNISSEKEKLSDMKDQNDSSAMSYQSDEENYDCEELEQEVKCLQEMPDLKQDVKGISEMVQEMCFVSNSINDQCTGQNTLNDMEEGNDYDVGFSAINVDAIIQFNGADYDEDGDPDYEQQIVDGRNTD